MRAAGDPASRIAAWQARGGRHHLPWQATRDPYRIWLSEIMLQQTQATTVIPYYERFLERFPDVRTLANAPLDAVLHGWAGLGYYARARNLHRCAQVIRDDWGGAFPRSAGALASLPGIGPSTAAAIAAFAYGERAAILDGNVRRVLARYYALESDPGSAAAMRQLWQWAQAWLDQAPADLNMRAYTQGQMDLGATICTRTQPDCAHCPLAASCEARRQGRQQELPRPRARRAQPQRSCQVLILEHAGQILLQRRPERGLWGGLWTLPQFDTPQDLQAACTAWAGAGFTLQDMAVFEHVFTHFRLRIAPHRLVLAAPPAQAAPAGQAWVPVPALTQHGMPAPILRLLAGLYAL